MLLIYDSLGLRDDVDMNGESFYITLINYITFGKKKIEIFKPEVGIPLISIY